MKKSDTADAVSVDPTFQKPLRLWPGVVAVALMWLLRYIVPIIIPDAAMFAIFGGLGLGLVVVLWWLFFSRAPWVERVGALVLMVVALAVTKRFVHPSIAGGMQGMLLFVYAVPVLCLALVAGAVVSRGLSTGPRRATIMGAILLACGVFTLIRTAGIIGIGSEFHWRWTPTPEELLLVQASSEKEPENVPISLPAPAAAPVETPLPAKTSIKPAAVASPAPAERVAEKKAEWPGFRGPERDNVIHGVGIETDWSQSPPVELWRKPIGPAWSSFAVNGSHIYTQEQRGEEEIVSCSDLNTGELVWKHGDSARFWESNAGAGPRATPTLSNGRVYTFGATGILNALDARDGSVVWSRNAASDADEKLPAWGFAGSPLVIDSLVVATAAGRLIAYELATGKPRWYGPNGGWGYSSPHLAVIDGVAQILLLNGEGVISVAPAEGKLLWKHEWKSDGIVQPCVIAGSDVLIGSGSGGVEVGMRRIAVVRDPEGWRVEERWTSTGLKPYFSDFVVHKGHAFGVDGSILSCIDLTDGKRKWKGGRYGAGQMVLLPDQDLLLVLSEHGELALVNATPDQFTELARFPAIKGKTWNHPVLVGNLLLVRNSQEMVAFRLPVART
ncbi:PQQ-like beta-propeller repeat protein [candidate division KSB1 bacterium]|nr:PQQ-like beta-propeller repeat protein [candidate division KSB1 bacterium]